MEDLIYRAEAQIKVDDMVSKIGENAIFKYFIENEKDNLTIYKQEKNSGYYVHVLYKNTVSLFHSDFITQEAKSILMIGLRESNEWHVYPINKLLVAWANSNGLNPWDNRFKYPKFQKSFLDAFDATNILSSKLQHCK